MSAHPFLAPSPYESDGGEIIGRDPRTISETEWRAVSADVVVGMRAIRAKCLDCCARNAAEVRKCVMVDCALWPLRMGVQPKGLRFARKADTLAGEDGPGSVGSGNLSEVF